MTETPVRVASRNIAEYNRNAKEGEHMMLPLNLWETRQGRKLNKELGIHSINHEGNTNGAKKK